MSRTDQAGGLGGCTRRARDDGCGRRQVKRIQSVPLVIGQFLEMIDANHGVVSSTAGSHYYVRVLSTINRELLKPSSSVALHRHSNSVVDTLPPEADSSIQMMQVIRPPHLAPRVPLPLSKSCPTLQSCGHASSRRTSWNQA